jgi:hypothetical protein
MAAISRARLFGLAGLAGIVAMHACWAAGVRLFPAIPNPSIVAAAAVAAFQLAASVAGRGRGVGRPRAAAIARAGIAAALLGGMLVTLWMFVARLPPGGSSSISMNDGGGAAALPIGDPAPWFAAGAALSVAFFALCEASARARGPSVALMAALAGAFASGLRAGEFLDALVALAIQLVSVGVVLLVLRLRRLDRARLALVGISPWAPGDLALIPALASELSLSVLRPWVIRAGSSLAWFQLVRHALGLPFAIGAAAGLVYLDRRLREAEARAAAAAPAQAAAP